jgi:Phage Mu protein F like protein
MQKAAIRRSEQRHIDALIKRRAFKTAEYELARANNRAKRLSVADALRTGIAREVEKEWVTEEDEKVCPTCRPLHGRTMRARSVGALMRAWEKGISSPPAHINCRCVETYRVVT